VAVRASAVRRAAEDGTTSSIPAEDAAGTALGRLPAGDRRPTMARMTEDARPADPGEDGGDPACWLRRVCPACGRLADVDPPVRCAACGELLPAD
jgi:hypothetical protein